LVLAGASGAALLHPPKSSSGATFGACAVLPQPLLEVEIWLDEGVGAPPQAEKSLDIGIEGTITGAAGLGLGGAVGVGSGVAHASLEPQASMLLKPDVVVLAGATGFCAGREGAAGAERLNAELMVEEGADAGGFCGVGAGCGALAGGDGSEKSNRSLEALVVEGLDGAGADDDAKLKSPKSFDDSGSIFA